MAVFGRMIVVVVLLGRVLVQELRLSEETVDSLQRDFACRRDLELQLRLEELGDLPLVKIGTRKKIKPSCERRISKTSGDVSTPEE